MSETLSVYHQFPRHQPAFRRTEWSAATALQIVRVHTCDQASGNSMILLDPSPALYIAT
jgi:hypothetical protein